MTTQTIESQAARAQVLSYYRKLRHAGLSPADTMAQLRDAYAHYIALAVWRGVTPPADVVQRWGAAHTYSVTMTGRPLWWWRTH